MNPARRKWTDRLLVGVVVILTLYLLARAADFVWFRIQVPVGFQTAKWSGRWTTQRYGGLSGRLLVRLPDPLPENREFKAEALVYYPLYSAWKPGQFVKMDFAGEFSPDSPGTAGQSSNRIPSGEPAGGKLKFKAKAGDQVVDYVAVMDETRTRILGGYVSRSPLDYGFFRIRYY